MSFRQSRPNPRRDGGVRMRLAKMFGEIFFLLLPLLPGFECSIHETWGLAVADRCTCMSALPALSARLSATNVQVQNYLNNT